MKRLSFFLLLWLCSLVSRANHIIGGDISLLALDKNKPGYYRIQVIQYWETAALQGNQNQDPIINILIFRKQNPILIEKLQVDLRTTTPLVYDNEACATLMNLKTTQAIYYRDYQFDISKYTDPDGYYIVWERCCRNNAPTNLANSTNIGMMLYMEFPPMNMAGSPNSSPSFSLPNGAYICLNKPFTFDFSATDTDGDQLRYSLVTPLRGYTTAQELNPDDLPKTSYPEVSWRAGFSTQNAIPGNPPLQINPTTGQLQVSASQEGIFLFTVQVEEYRNGQRIGLSRRDFQLPVVDCTPKNPPVAHIRYNGQPVTDIGLCPTQTATLTVENDPSFVYQWQKNGIKLTGMTSFSLSVADTGTYTVIKRYATSCAGDTVSEGVRVRRIVPPTVTLTAAQQTPYCTGDTITLQATDNAAYQYRWVVNGQSISGADRTAIRAYQSGSYIVTTQVAGSSCTASDTLALTFHARPDAQLRLSAPTFCTGDSVVLTAAQGTGYEYQWTPAAYTGNPLVVRQGGSFQVRVTTPSGCWVLSELITIQQNVRPSVQLDSIPPFCGPSSASVTLHGMPAGGTYSGNGVEGGVFLPAKAGAGLHPIRYTFTSSEGCSAVAVRWANVSEGIRILLPDQYVVAKGGQVRLEARVNEPVEQTVWSPVTDLDNPQTLQPVASPGQTTLYQLVVTNAAGCSGSAVVTVKVTEQLIIPSAFTPNGDGINDVWELRNTAAFPDCEVVIYNRWGEVIFQSLGYTVPWNGTYRHQPVTPGTYAYMIRTSQPYALLFTGQVTVLK